MAPSNFWDDKKSALKKSSRMMIPERKESETAAIFRFSAEIFESDFGLNNYQKKDT